MSENSTTVMPPYASTGEVCQFLIGAFGTKAENPVRRKELSRLARDGDFDWRLPGQLIDGLLSEPLRKFDPEFGNFVGNFTNWILEQHIEMVLRLPLDALSRGQALTLLIEGCYSAHIASFMGAVWDQFGGPDIRDFILKDSYPVDVVFDWMDRVVEGDIGRIVYPDDKQKRDDIARWRRGDTIPDFYASIMPLMRRLQEKLPNQTSEIALFGKWLMTARALAWIDRRSRDAGYKTVLDLVRRELLLNCPQRDIGRILSKANFEASRSLSELVKCGLVLKETKLSRLQLKSVGDQTEARKELDRFAVLTEECAPDGHTRYLLDWCEGRWLVLSGQEEKALAFYEKAVRGALYRAGESQKTIIEEALALAAHLKKKAPLKRLKHQALALNLFSEVFTQFDEQSDIVPEWEVEQFAQSFRPLFPDQGRFPEAPPSDRHVNLPFRVYDRTATLNLKPDLANPNRVISIKMKDGKPYRRPQLIWFASEGQVDEVRSLLDAGADVNKLDEQGGSALLNALQHAKQTGDRRVVDLLLTYPHKKETLNQMSKKKRLSPLHLAVQLGEPDIVEALLDMGSSVDQQASIQPISALYLCVEKLGIYGKEKERTQALMRKMMSPTPEGSDAIRRYLGGLAGVFGDNTSLIDLTNPRHAMIMNEIGEYFFTKDTDVPRNNRMDIVNILLEHGADPNLRHSSCGPGRTPLMMAAEADLLDAFRLLQEHGGNPMLTDDDGNNCFVIARGFNSMEVFSYLRQSS